MRIPHLLAAGLLLAATYATPAVAQPEAETAARLWSYAGPTAPAFWARLGFPACAGPRQSPIDLPGEPWSFTGVETRYRTLNHGRLVNDGHTVILQLPPGNSLLVADTTFEFREMHLHVPAEHTVQGHRHDAEIHTVYQLGNGNRAVLTTFVRDGDSNPAWNTLIAVLPGNKGDSFPISVDLAALLSLQNVSTERMYSYPGSLTTPACTPDVRFLVRETQITLSRDQLDNLASAMPRNVRPVQPTPAPSAAPP